MIVQYICIKPMQKSLCAVDELHRQVGANVPMYLEIDESYGRNYLFCIANADVCIFKKLCKEHFYEIMSMEQDEIEESMYNSKYKAVPVYFSKKSYGLELH
jgi:hypothetical protein